MGTNITPLLDHRCAAARNNMSRFIKTVNGEAVPERFLLSFMKDALDAYVERDKSQVVAKYRSEVREFPIYRTEVAGIPIGIVQTPVGAPAAAILADLLIASGAKHLIACGGCGVLSEIKGGVIMVPTSALRDEGTSLHYLDPSRTIDISGVSVDAVRKALTEHGVPFRECRTWTTDGFFRETPELIERRKAEGCQAVEMECSALAAVARAYGASFAEILYSGDDLSKPNQHDERNWIFDFNARSIAFLMSLSALSKIDA